MDKFRFRFNCVSAPGGDSAGDHINEMKRNSLNIARSTFLRKIDRKEMKDIELSLGYFSNHKKGLVMKNDWHVSYWKSNYNGKPCYYFQHSGIEYVFLKG